jgi:hypothetical protein
MKNKGLCPYLIYYTKNDLYIEPETRKQLKRIGLSIKENKKKKVIMSTSFLENGKDLVNDSE